MPSEVLLEMSDSVLKEEKIVLDIVQEYLNKNRTFIKTEIIPFINAKVVRTQFNLSYNGICEILKSLVEKNIIVEGSKLTKFDIFSNINRKKLYEHIIKNPGCHFNKLVKTLNLSIFSTEWHLNVLIKFNLIRKARIENFEAYFDSRMTSQDDEILHIISRNKCKKIIQFLKENEEGYSKNFLAKALSINPNTVSKYI